MRRLKGSVERQLAIYFIHGGKRAAGFKRTRVDALIGDQLLDLHLGLVEGSVRTLTIARGPGKNVIGMLAWPMRAGGFVFDVLPENWGSSLHRLEGIHEHRQFFVLDFHEFGRVRGGITVLGDNEGDFLVLE